MFFDGLDAHNGLKAKSIRRRAKPKRQTVVTHLIGACRQRVAVNCNQRKIEVFAIEPQWRGATDHWIAPDIERRGDISQSRIEIEFERDVIKQKVRRPIVGAANGDSLIVSHRVAIVARACSP